MKLHLPQGNPNRKVMVKVKTLPAFVAETRGQLTSSSVRTQDVPLPIPMCFISRNVCKAGSFPSK